MFEFLFKYPAADFATGEFVSILAPWQWALLPPALAALGFVALGYFRQRGQTRRGDRFAIALMRGLALAVILFSLSSPLLEVNSRLPQPGIVGLLFDDSVSMGLANAEGATRADFVRRQFDPNGGALLQDLRHRFDLRLFKFGAEARAIATIDALEFDDDDTVQRVEAIKGGNNCTSDGRCFRTHKEGFVVLGTDAEDANARSHVPPEGHCAVFAYTNRAPGCPITRFSLWQGEQPVARSLTNRKGYLFWSLEADEKPTTLHAMTIAGFKDKNPPQLSVDCESGQTYIYEARRSCNPYLTLWDMPAKVTLRQVEPEEAKAALDKRTLVIQ